MNNETIKRSDAIEAIKALHNIIGDAGTKAAVMALDGIQEVDVVTAERYNDIRNDFIDYVCSGIQNPAPYCGNADDNCINARGWCVYSVCKGFSPKED